MPDLEIIEKRIASFIEDLQNLKKYQNVTAENIKGISKNIILLIHWLTSEEVCLSRRLFVVFTYLFS